MEDMSFFDAPHPRADWTHSSVAEEKWGIDSNAVATDFRRGKTRGEAATDKLTTFRNVLRLAMPCTSSMRIISFLLTE